MDFTTGETPANSSTVDPHVVIVESTDFSLFPLYVVDHSPNPFSIEILTLDRMYGQRIVMTLGSTCLRRTSTLTSDRVYVIPRRVLFSDPYAWC